MLFTIVTPPSVLPFSAVDMRQELFHPAEDDGYVEALIGGATALVDGWSGNSGIALMPQTLGLYMPGFPGGKIPIMLPVGPVTSIDKITYADPEGEAQTIDPANYRLTVGALIPTEDWPATAMEPDAVFIVWNAGKGCPPTVDRAIRLLVCHWYAHREAAAETAMHNVPLAVKTLLAQSRSFVHA